MSGLQISDMVIIILYFLLMVGIGFYSRKKTKNQEEFFMGGRGFGKIIQTFAAFGAGTSSESPVGTVRNTYVYGISGIWTVLCMLFCTPFYWFFGKWYRRMRVITTGDFYDERYNSRGLAGMYAIFALVVFMGYISISFSAGSKTITAIAPKSEETLTIEEKQELSDFNRMKQLEEQDYAVLSPNEKQELENLRVKNPRGLFPVISLNLLIILLGIVTLIYSIVGGITAAYLNDLLQGTMIIFLSVILVPYALIDITGRYGGSSIFDGFKIMHNKLPEEFFDIFGSPYSSDFTWYYVTAIVLINLIGVIAQPQQISIGGATAKDELTGRVGIVSGNLIKRFCTLFWALTALLILTLFPRELSDPDLVWGYATRILLGPVGLGLVGLMLASLFAAIMAAVSAYLVSSSALIVRNLYQPIFPDKSEKLYVNIGRLAGVIVISGATYLSIYFQDIFVQFKFIWEIPIIFGASLWIGLLWRRATAHSVWAAVVLSSFLFFILPVLLPSIIPGLTKSEKYLLMTQPAPITKVYEAKEFNVVERDREIEKWNTLSGEQKLLAPQPEKIKIGDKIQKTIKPKGASIFWTKGIKINKDGTLEGDGFFNLEMILYQKLGLKLENLPNALIETLRLPFRIFLPIVIIIIVSLFTSPVDKKKTDAFFTKMRLKVDPDPFKDKENLEKAWQNPESLEHRKMFPNTNFEFVKWTKEDAIGFIAIWIIVGIIILLTIGMTLIGA
ncbi:MAG: sodium:solute symporter family protein [Patescibacteria group bacterium]|nr:sodium:solute symporter family protein [Patescibacteria group bacterium]